MAAGLRFGAAAWLVFLIGACIPKEPPEEGRPDLSVEPSALTFSDVVQGQSERRFATLTNRGNGVSRITRIVIEGEAAFTVEGDLESPLAAGAHRDLAVHLTPAAAEAYAATLMVEADGRTHRVSLSGRGVAPKVCEDANPCTTDTYELDRCVHTPRPDGSACDDGNACTEADRCLAGACERGPRIVCDDGDPCTADRCDVASGCLHVRLDAALCDDGEPCTYDHCSPNGGCTHTVVVNGTTCNDGTACGAKCYSGRCQTSPTECNDHNPCTADTCDPVTGCHRRPVPDGTWCGASEGCEVPVCVSGVCGERRPIPDDGPCIDGDLCTFRDRCNDGVCEGLPVDCNTYRPCTTGRCDPATGGCVVENAPEGTACGPESPCTVRVCRSGECATEPIADGTACDDANACTDASACTDGHCLGDARCDDGNPCTLDGCRPDEGCVHVAEDDGARCGPAEACQDARVCEGGTCSTVARLPDGTPCNDGSLCTTGETCSDGACVDDAPGTVGTLTRWKPTWDGAGGLAVVGPDRVLAADPGRIALIDTSQDPARPIHQVFGVNAWFSAAAPLGGNRYVTVRQESGEGRSWATVRVVRLDGSGFSELGRLELPGSYAAPRLAVNGLTAYVAYGPWVHVVDLRSPESPSLATRMAYTSGIGVALNPATGELLVLDATGRLLAYDLSAPRSPVLARELEPLTCVPAIRVPTLAASERYVVASCSMDREFARVLAVLDAPTYRIVRKPAEAGWLQGMFDAERFVTISYRVIERPSPCEQRVTIYVGVTHGEEGSATAVEGTSGWAAAGHGLLVVPRAPFLWKWDGQAERLARLEAIGRGVAGRVVEGAGQLLSVRDGNVMGLDEDRDGGFLFTTAPDGYDFCGEAVRGGERPPGGFLTTRSRPVEEIPCPIAPPALCWLDLVTRTCRCSAFGRHFADGPSAVGPFGKYLLTIRPGAGGPQFDVFDMDQLGRGTAVPEATTTVPVARYYGTGEVLGGPADGSHVVASYTTAGENHLVDLDTRRLPAVPWHVREDPQGTFALLATRSRWARLTDDGTGVVLRVETRHASSWPPTYTSLADVALPHAERLLAFDGDIVVAAGPASAPAAYRPEALWVVDLRASPPGVAEYPMPDRIEYGAELHSGFAVSGRAGVGIVDSVCAP